MDIGRRIRLEPHERLRVPVNLREYWVGGRVDSAVLVGSTVELVGVLNPRIATGPASGKPVPVPGPLGMVADSGQFQVEGQRIDPADIESICSRLLSRETDRELKEMAVLAHLLADADGTVSRQPLTEPQRQMVDAALSEKWPRLSLAQQAWLVTVIPLGEGLGTLGDLIDSSTDPLIERLILIRIGTQADPETVLDDPRLIAGLRSTDPKIYTLATMLESFMRRVAEAQLQGGG